MVDTFCFFSSISGLKPNLTRSEIAVTRLLKSPQVAACGMRCIYINNDTLTR